MPAAVCAIARKRIPVPSDGLYSVRLAGQTRRIVAEIFLIQRTILADEKRCDSRVSVFDRPSQNRESAGHLAINEVIFHSRCSLALIENAITIPVELRVGATICRALEFAEFAELAERARALASATGQYKPFCLPGSPCRLLSRTRADVRGQLAK